MAEESPYDEVSTGEGESVPLGTPLCQLVEPPWQLRLTAVIFLWSGLGALWAVIHKATQGGIHFDFSLIALVWAFGILRRARPSLFWAKWSSRFVAAALLSVLLVLVYRKWNYGHAMLDQIGIELTELPPLDFSFAVGTLLSFGTLFWVAASFSFPSVRAYCSLPPSPSNLPSSRTWMAIISVVIVLANVSQTERLRNVGLNAPKGFDAAVQVIAKDAQTGAALSDMEVQRASLPGQLIHLGHRTGETWKLTRDAAGDRPNWRAAYNVSGHILNKLRLKVQSPGYEAKEIIVDKSSPEAIEVALDPLK